jgi:hypothetical protein
MSAQEKVSFSRMPKAEITEVHGNLSQQVVVITVDKLRLILQRRARGLSARTEWQGPAGVLLSLVATLATTNFKDWILTAGTWNMLFVVAAILAAIQLIRSLAQLRNAETVDSLAEHLKRQEE